MTMRRLTILKSAIASCMLLTCVSLCAAAATDPDAAAKRKADYYYMEAMRQNALGNKDAYYELLRR